MKKKSKQRQRPHRPAGAAPPQPGEGAQRWLYLNYTGIVAAALGVLLYAATLGFGYCYDDSSAIVDNRLVQSGVIRIPTLLATEYRYGYDVRHNPGPHYRPLSLVAFALVWQVAGDRAWAFHLVNVLLYGFTGYFLWIALGRILAGQPPALVAAAVLLFMAHPVHTEVVANIKSIDEILTLLFLTGSLYWLWRYFENKRRLRLGVSLALFALALLTKESAITFLAVVPLTLWFFTDKKPPDIIRTSALYLVPAALFLVARSVVLSDQDLESGQSIITNFIGYAPTLTGRLASACMMAARYFQVLVFPHPLVCDMGYPQVHPVTFLNGRAAIGLLCFIGLGGLGLYGLRARHILSYAGLFFLVTFSIYSNIVYLIGTAYGERLLYYPSVGFALATAWLLHRIFRPEKTGTLLPMGIACGVIIVLYGAATLARVPAWKDDYTLFSTDIATSPRSAHMNFNYAKQLLIKGYDKKRGVLNDAALVEQAIAYFSRSLELFPDNFEAWGERGWSYVRLKQYDKAYADYMKALELNPASPQALSALGYLCRNFRGEPERAEELYRQAIAADPRFIEPRRNLGALLAARGQFQQAIEVWKAGLEIAPDDVKLLEFVGHAYKDMGKPDEARPWLEKAAAPRAR